jgi:hypothetical protein
MRRGVMNGFDLMVKKMRPGAFVVRVKCHSLMNITPPVRFIPDMVVPETTHKTSFRSFVIELHIVNTRNTRVYLWFELARYPV